MTAKEARKQKGITLIKLSEDTGLSIALLSKIENGRTKLTTRTKQILDNYYNEDIITTNYTTQLELQIEQLNNEIELYKDEIDLLHAIISDLRITIGKIGELVNETYHS